MRGKEYKLSQICVVTFLDPCINLGTGDPKTRFFIFYLSAHVSESRGCGGKELDAILSYSRVFGLNLEEQGKGDGLQT